MTKQEIGGKENKEFYEDARKVAESCSKERLVELYLAEVQTCCEVEEYKEIADNTIEMYAEKCKALEKALELAVADKCKFENALLSTALGNVGAKVAVPKKEQWYLEQAKEMLENE